MRHRLSLRNGLVETLPVGCFADPVGGEGGGASGAGGAGGGAGGGGASHKDQDGKDIHLTQDQLNSILANHKRELQDKLALTQDGMTKLLKESEATREFLKKLESLVPKDDADDEDDEDDEDADEKKKKSTPLSKLEARLVKHVTKLQKQAEEREASVRQELERIRADRDKEVQRRRTAERDNALADALTAAECLDMRGGIRYFKDSLVYDETKDMWMYDDEQGNRLSVKEGIVRDIPSYLKKPKTDKGGSGGQGPLSHTVEEAKTVLEKAEAAMLAAKQAAAADPRDADLAAKFVLAKREYARLKQEYEKKAQ